MKPPFATATPALELRG